MTSERRLAINCLPSNVESAAASRDVALKQILIAIQDGFFKGKYLEENTTYYCIAHLRWKNGWIDG